MQEESEAAPPLVSVVIPSFNHGRYVTQAVESALAQDYPALEVVVVDDGSKDDSHDVLRGLADRHPGRVRIFLNERNAGQGVRLNFGIAQAEGEFICILPSDDFFLPGKIARQVETFAAGGPRLGLVYTDGCMLDDATGALSAHHTPMLSGDLLLELLRCNFFLPASTMIRKTCFETIPFDESYVAEGEAIFVRIARHWLVAGVPEALTVMRTHGDNTGSKSELMYRELKRWYGDFLADPTLPDAVRAEAPFLLGRIHRMKGLEFVAKGHDRHAARDALRQAMATYPPYRYDPKVWLGLLATMTPVTARLAQRAAAARVRATG